jgi:prepilin peptidase CpaA
MNLLALKLGAFLALLAAAAILDLRDRRLPNALTVGGVAAGVLLDAALVRGLPSAALVGAALGVGVGFPLFALGAVGAGDAKLFAAVGAFLGPVGLLMAALYGAVAGGILAIVGPVRRGTILPVLLDARNLLIHYVTLGRHGERRAVGAPGAVTIPYGVAIAAGALAAWFFPQLPGGAL